MKKAKYVLSLILALILCFDLSACGDKRDDLSSPSVSPATPPDLSGQWKQINSNSEDSYQGAIIDGDVIEIYWVSDGGNTRSLYWSGTYSAPATTEEPYSWESINNEEKTAHALLASSDSSKTFTYKSGQISYSASALGSTSTIRMEKEEWDAGLKIEPAEPQNVADDSVSENTSSKNNITYFSFSLGGIEFSIPSYYEIAANESTNESTTFNANTGDFVQLILGETKCENESEFDSAVEEMISSVGDVSEVSFFPDVSLAGLHSSSFSASGKTNGVATTIGATLAYHPDIQKAILIAFMKAGNLQYDYEADYNALILTAKLAEPLSTTSAFGIRPELKEAMDSFEAFFDEYVTFMQKFSNSSDTLSLLSAYTDYMARYTETMDALSKLKESDMSTEETLYYLEVLSRITKKLSEVSQ